mgnify:CR=1 FL=1
MFWFYLCLGTVILAALLLTAGVCIWVYQDAKERGERAWLWVLIILISSPLLGGLVYLIARNLAKWYTTLSFLLPIAVLSAINHPYGVSPLESIANEVFAGSLFFVAVYIINDPVTTPKYRIARVIYGLCAGLLTMVFRYYSPLEFSAVFAVLLMNALAPAFDTLCEFLIPWMNQQEQLPDNRKEASKDESNLCP